MTLSQGFPGGSDNKESAGDPGLSPGSGRSSGEENGPYLPKNSNNDGNNCTIESYSQSAVYKSCSYESSHTILITSLRDVKCFVAFIVEKAEAQRQ